LKLEHLLLPAPQDSFLGNTEVSTFIASSNNFFGSFALVITACVSGSVEYCSADKHVAQSLS